MSAEQLVVGLDFGTTNSSLAVARPDRRVALARFRQFERVVSTFRSLLYFSVEEPSGPGAASVFAGPQAIEMYLDEVGSGRLMQSLKSFLASGAFDQTQVLRETFRLADLIGFMIDELRTQAEWQFGDLGRRAVVGRPVRYVGADDATDEERAVDRMRRALVAAGFDEVVFEYEPVAAALDYESRLEADEVVLVADFGGGTSDFCAMLVGPGVRQRGRRDDDILGTVGVPLAGDAFDSRIVYRLIAPHLGLGSRYLSESQRMMDVPPAIYHELSSWHRVAFLRRPQVMANLARWERGAAEPDRLAALRTLIEDNLGFDLYRRVGAAKRRLSTELEAAIDWDLANIHIEAPFGRKSFEGWIAEDLRAISDGLDELLRQIGAAERPRTVDRVFLTGGTSLVPAVRRLFERRFGADRIGTGDELTAVATGLALCASDRWH